MKLEIEKDPFISADRITGFVRILELGQAQQVEVNIDKFKEVAKIVSGFDKIGFDTIVITVEKDKPIILGSKVIGIGIAPTIT